MIKLKKSAKIKYFIRLFNHIKIYKQTFFFILLITIFITFLNLVPLYLIKPLTDKVLAPVTPTPVAERIHWLNILIFVLIVVSVLQQLVSVKLNYTKELLGERIGNKIRNILYTHMQKLPLKFYNAEATGELQSRVIRDTDNIKNFFSFTGIEFFRSALMLLGIGSILFCLDWQMALIIMLPMPVVTSILTIIFTKRMALFFRKSYQKTANLTSVLFNFISGILVIKTSVTEYYELNKFKEASENVVRSKMEAMQSIIFFSLFITLSMSVTGILLRWIGGLRVIYDRLTLGELMVFMGYLWQFMGPVKAISNTFADFERTIVAAERFFKILDEKPEIFDIYVPLPNLRGDIRFQNVSFSYDGRNNVLENITFNVEHGSIMGITGPSGGGKTTLIFLLSRLYNATEGSIFIDNFNIGDADIYSLRQQIGIILQDTFLFRGTIAENIAYAQPDASKEQIINAAVAANAHNFIIRFPNAYDTFIGEKGAGLSGGEKQRIAITRAFLKNSKIFIFDEATSSVDATTEIFIEKTIMKLSKNHTVIMITHKLAALKIADKIIVIDKGKLVEDGTYNSLSKSEGLFSQLLMHRYKSK